MPPEKARLLIIAVVIALVVMVIYYNYSMYNLYSHQIEGMWVAPESFCKESDIDGMLVYVGPKLSSAMGREKRKVCLIMHGNNVTIAYKKLEIVMGSPIMNMLIPFTGVPSKWSRSAKVSDDSGEVADPEIDIMNESDDASTIPLEKIMPENITITVDLNEGKMSWTGPPLERSDDSEECTYAELYKDNASSAIGKNIHESAAELDDIIPEF